MANEQMLVIAVSARVLFDLEEPNEVFEKGGVGNYLSYQRAHENEPLRPGPAFPAIKALLALNAHAPDGQRLVDVIVMSSNHPDSGLRIMKSIAHHGLDIARAAFTGGGDVIPYLEAFQADLLLSRSQEDAQRAVDKGIAAALMYDLPEGFDTDDAQIRIALDGDAVIFSDESEKIYKEKGFAAFRENESRLANQPMKDGPFAHFLRKIHGLQSRVTDGAQLFRIALVTARGGPARERVINTLRSWNVTVDEAYFLDGVAKDGVLSVFKPHIFFDDQDVHVRPASMVVPAGRVPYRSAEPVAVPQGEDGLLESEDGAPFAFGPK